MNVRCYFRDCSSVFLGFPPWMPEVLLMWIFIHRNMGLQCTGLLGQKIAETQRKSKKIWNKQQKTSYKKVGSDLSTDMCIYTVDRRTSSPPRPQIVFRFWPDCWPDFWADFWSGFWPGAKNTDLQVLPGRKYSFGGSRVWKIQFCRFYGRCSYSLSSSFSFSFFGHTSAPSHAFWTKVGENSSY